MNADQRDDLRYLREMAEAGRRAPLLGGRFYVFWGVLVALAYSGQYLILSGSLGVGEAALGVLWLGFGAAAAIGQPLLTRSIRNKPGRGAVNNRVETVVWTTGGFVIMSFVIGVFIATVVLGSPAETWDFIVAVALGAYGTALITTGTVAEAPWMRLPALIAIGSVAIVPPMVGKPVLYLIAAMVVVVVALIPGLILLSKEPRSLPPETADA